MIQHEDRDGVTLLRLDHGKVNALDLELCEAIADAFDGLAADAPAVVLTGAGSAFSAGVDLQRMVDGGEDYVAAFLPALSRMFLAIFDHPGPTVAAVNGHAIAGGYVVAAACDHRLVADGKARVGLTELRVGVPFPTAAIEIVRHAIGPAAARTLVTTAGLFGPDEAVALGALDRAVAADELEAEALALATTMGGFAPDAFQLAKRQLHGPARAAIEERTPIDDVRVEAIWSAPNAGQRIVDFLASVSSR